MHTTRMLRRAALVCVAAASLTACIDRGGPTDNPPYVPPSRVKWLTITPPEALVKPNTTVRLNASAQDASRNPVSDESITWASSDPSIATVDSTGVVTTYQKGTATITATVGTLAASAPIDVGDPDAPSSDAWVSVSPGVSDVLVGNKVQLTATVRNSAGALVNGATVTFSSSDPHVATVSQSGLVTAATPGSVVITVQGSSSAATASVNVSATSVSNVSVSPASSTLAVRGSLHLTATVVDSRGQTVNDRPINWASSNPAVANVSTTGDVMARAPGSTTIQAIVDGVVGSSTITVVPPTATTVAITPSSSGLKVGSTLTLAARVMDATGAAMSGAPVTWTTSDANIARVSSSGVVSGIAPGTATITAQSGAAKGSASIIVDQVSVASVQVAPATTTLQPLGTAVLTATARDASGTALSGRVINWTSSDSTVVSVTSSGQVTALSVGSVTITATSSGVSGTAVVSVNAPSTTPSWMLDRSREPSGMSVITDRPFNTVATSLTDYADAEGWTTGEGSSHNTSIISDPQAPRSPSSVLQLRYPQGLPTSQFASFTPAHLWMPVTTQPRTVYQSFWLKLSANWDGHYSGANKLTELFINNKVTVVLGVLGAGTGNLYPSICLDAGPDPRLGMYLPLNVAKIPMSRGQWHRLEYVVVANTPGVRDGQATWWLDGQMLAHYTDIAWVPAGAPNYWMQLSIDPIWGGVGGTLPADQFLYIDHLYASGK